VVLLDESKAVLGTMQERRISKAIFSIHLVLTTYSSAGLTLVLASKSFPVPFSKMKWDRTVLWERNTPSQINKRIQNSDGDHTHFFGGAKAPSFLSNSLLGSDRRGYPNFFSAFQLSC